MTAKSQRLMLAFLIYEFYFLEKSTKSYLLASAKVAPIQSSRPI